jgi:hypothetical protein
MAGFFQAGIQPTTSTYLRDYTHASKTFGSNGFANAPKFKWLFHVYFDINMTLIDNNITNFPSPEIPGLLVKNINLPKFNIAVSEMNQYNRKRYIQTKLTYDPIQVVFHDDNLGQIRDMWYKYFSYYYNDPTQPYGLNVQNAIDKINVKNQYYSNISDIARWGYLGEPNSASLANGVAKAPFFRSIRVYGFNQHNFALYELVNPIIERFEHDTYDYYQTSGTMENRMTIRYETVKYQQGALNGTEPSQIVSGFGLPENYDRTISPITIPGANSQAMGQGGLVDVGNGIVSDLNTLLNAGSLSSSQAQTFNNPQTNFTNPQQQIIDGAKNAGTNPDTTRSQFNLPSLSSVYGPTAQYGSSNNYRSPVAPKIPTPANNPIAQESFSKGPRPPSE